MLLLSLAPSNEELIAAVEKWIDLLAEGDYEAAFASTEHHPYYRWSPDLMRSVVAGYGLPEPHPSGEVFAVTARVPADGGPPDVEVLRSGVPLPAIAEIWHALPLNGSWSDLTATFVAVPRDQGCVLVLHEIHVF